MKTKRVPWHLALVVLAVLACKGGKSKSDVFAVLDKHKLEYGKCEILAESKESVDGQPAWIAASVCRAKHRQAVLTEVGEAKKFEEWFTAWKKENGPKAITEARSAPASTGDTASGSGGDCPNGSGCLNRCKSECEGKHGALIDLVKMKGCTKVDEMKECMAGATNQTTRKCFFECRGLPMP